MAPPLTSHAEMGLHHGKKETMKGISLLSVMGRKVPTLGQGCQVNGHYSCRTQKSRRRRQLASKMRWGVTSAGKALWQQCPWHTEHCTAEVAGRQQRSLTQFIWEEIKYHAIPRSKTAGEVCRTPDVKSHLPSPKH